MTAVEYPGGSPVARHFRANRGDAVRLSVTGRNAGAELDLALPIQTVDARGAHARHQFHDVVEAHEPADARGTYRREIVSGSARSSGVRRSSTS